MIETCQIGLLGAGNMGSSLAIGLARHGRIPPSQLTVVDIRADALEPLARLGMRTSVEVEDAARDQDVVILAIKPQIAAEVLETLAPHLRGDQLLVSIMAGVSTSSIEEWLGGDAPLVRTMPQITARLGVAATAVCTGRHASKRHAELARELFDAVGTAVMVEESQMDGVHRAFGKRTGRYVYSIIEALSEGGVRVGLSREVATKLAIQTVLGAASMALESGEQPGTLRDQVTSPGGTTFAGLQALERGGLSEALIGAVEAAAERSVELGRS